MTATFDEMVARLEGEDRALFRGGWRRAVVGAAIAAAVVGAFGELVGLLLAWGHAVPGLNAAQGARFGWAMFFAAHHAGIELRTGGLHLPGRTGDVLGMPEGYALTATVSVGLVGVTLLAMWLLYRAGGRIADEVGGRALRRGAHGAKVAVPYTVIAAVASLPLRFTLRLPQTSPFSVHPSTPDVVLRTFLIAAAAGFAGGLFSWRDGVWHSDWWETARWRDRWRAALAGGRTTLLLALGLSIGGLLVLAMARPQDTAAYMRTVFAAGPLSGIALLLLSLALLPNAAAWVFQPAMGGCIQIGGGGPGSPLPPYCFVSYSSILTHKIGPPPPQWWLPTLGPAPRVYLLFLLVPAVAVVAGTLRAVRVGEVRSGRSGLVTGAMAGTVFTALYTAFLGLATISVLLEGQAGAVPGFYRYGPYPAYGFGLAFAWGVLGGAAIGGVVGRLRRSGG